MAKKAHATPPSGGGGVTVEECQRMIRRSLGTPKVKAMREHMEKAGCRVGDNFFKAVNCKQRIAGGYLPGVGIVICSNAITFQDEVNQLMTHELIHAYDECRAKNLDWTNCAHHACSEIRANHLSGDCHFLRELLRGHMKIKGHEQEQRHRIAWRLSGMFVTTIQSHLLGLLELQPRLGGCNKLAAAAGPELLNKTKQNDSSASVGVYLSF